MVVKRRCFLEVTTNSSPVSLTSSLKTAGVPEFIRNNPTHAARVLELIEKLPDQLNNLETAIIGKNLRQVEDATLRFGWVGLYGYSDLASEISALREAAEREDDERIVVTRQLIYSIRLMLEGRRELESLAELVNESL